MAAANPNPITAIWIKMVITIVKQILGTGFSTVDNTSTAVTLCDQASGMRHFSKINLLSASI